MYPIKDGLKMAKNFTVSQRKKIENIGRPVLRAAYVDERYIWASEGNTLIRIEHNETVTQPYLHAYSKKDDAFLRELNPSIPVFSNLMPEEFCSTDDITITDVAKWQKAHEIAMTMKNEKHETTLTTNDKMLKSNAFKKEIFGGRMNFAYKNLPIKEDGLQLKITYNAEYMVRAMKTFKKIKIKEVTMKTRGSRVPFTLEAEGITILINPLKHNFNTSVAAEKETVGIS